MKPTKCFKCWQNGRITKNCTSEVDRSKCCIKCGAERHKTESCIGQLCCVLYVGKETNHVPGSRGCSVYEKQINLNLNEAPQDLLTQTVREKKVDVVIIADQ